MYKNHNIFLELEVDSVFAQNRFSIYFTELKFKTLIKVTYLFNSE